MPIRYTICHNDDNPKDPNHRRVLVEARRAGEGYEITADGEPVEMAPLCEDEDEADSIIHDLWDAQYWDLRNEIPETPEDIDKSDVA